MAPQRKRGGEVTFAVYFACTQYGTVRYRYGTFPVYKTVVRYGTGPVRYDYGRTGTGWVGTGQYGNVLGTSCRHKVNAARKPNSSPECFRDDLSLGLSIFLALMFQHVLSKNIGI